MGLVETSNYPPLAATYACACLTASTGQNQRADVNLEIPAALPLLLTGLASLGLMGWRKRKAA